MARKNYTKAEKRALEAFPLDTYKPGDMLREVFIRGYETAHKDSVEYIEHIKRCVKRQKDFSPAEKMDICFYLDRIKQNIETK